MPARPSASCTYMVSNAVSSSPESCTLAPAVTAFWTSTRHCARFADMLAVEHSCPTAYQMLVSLVMRMRLRMERFGLTAMTISASDIEYVSVPQ